MMAKNLISAIFRTTVQKTKYASFPPSPTNHYFHNYRCLQVTRFVIQKSHYCTKRQTSFLACHQSYSWRHGRQSSAVVLRCKFSTSRRTWCLFDAQPSVISSSQDDISHHSDFSSSPTKSDVLASSDYPVQSTSTPDDIHTSIDALPQQNPTDYIVHWLNNVEVGEPSLRSLGLGGLWPTGLAQHALEFLHVTCGLPWWTSIVIGVIITRACFLPFVISRERSESSFVITVTKLKKTSKKPKDHLDHSHHIESPLFNYVKKFVISRVSNWPRIGIYEAVVLSIIASGLQDMAGRPVPSMTEGGCLWFKDLTAADYSLGLPILIIGSYWPSIDALLHLTRLHTMTWARWGVFVFMSMTISHFSSAVLVFWVANRAVSILIRKSLHHPQVRQWLHLPSPQKQDTHPLRFWRRITRRKQ